MDKRSLQYLWKTTYQINGNIEMYLLTVYNIRLDIRAPLCPHQRRKPLFERSKK